MTFMRIAAGCMFLLASTVLAGCQTTGASTPAVGGSGAASQDVPSWLANADKALDIYQQLEGGVLQQFTERSRLNPYFLRREPPADMSGKDASLAAAGLNLKLFQYGRFCGPGVPAGLSAGAPADETAEQRAERLQANMRKLRARGAPVDRIDYLCFAHDYCYESIGRDLDACDFPMMVSLLETSTAFDRLAAQSQAQNDLGAQLQNAACSNLLWDMAIAFMVKPRQGTRVDLVGHAVRSYMLYNAAGGGDTGQDFLKTKLTNQATFGYPGDADVCRLPPEAEDPAGAAVAMDDFSSYANVAANFLKATGGSANEINIGQVRNWSDARRVFENMGRGLRNEGLDVMRRRTAPNPEANQREFAICIESDEACAETDAALATADWGWVQERIKWETGVYIAAMLGAEAAESRTGGLGGLFGG